MCDMSDSLDSLWACREREKVRSEKVERGREVIVTKKIKVFINLKLFIFSI